MARPSDGTTVDLRTRVTPDEAQMAADIAAILGTSGNRAIRWAIRVAWQHATSTTQHQQQCTGNSTCASATRAISGKGRQRAPRTSTTPEGQTLITHQATMGDDTP